MNSKTTLFTLLLILAAFVLSWLLFLLFPGIFETWKLQSNDSLFRLRYSIYGKRPTFPSIVHVDFDDTSARMMDVSIEDKVLYAKIINILTEAYVHSTAFDIVFPRGDNVENDEALVDATYNSDGVYFPIILRPIREGEAVEETDGEYEQLLSQIAWHPSVSTTSREIRATVAFSTFFELAEAAKGIGHITCYPDRDGVFRRFPLLIRVGEAYVPSLSFRMVCDYLDVSPEDIKVAFGKSITLSGARFPDGEQRDAVIPIDSQGRIIINFAGPWHDSFFHYPISKLLEAEEDRGLLDELTDQIEENLVVVSDVSTGGRDIGPIPLENLYPLSGLHVNIINSIIKEDFIGEFTLTQEFLISLLLVALLFGASYRMRGLGFTLSALALLILFVVVSALLFFYRGMLSNMVAPAFAILLTIVAVNVYKYLLEQKEKAFIHAKFENYFAPELLSKILKTPGMLDAVEQKVLTVLFSDIAGFSTWSSTQKPEYIRQTLNQYFEEMASTVFKYEGTINKYIGDGLMVLFGDPLLQEDHALRCVRAATEMQLKTRELKKKWEATGGMPIQIRIGINTGEVVVGNMGSSKRLEYTAIGANVNLAQRLESGAPVGGILIAKSVYEKVKDEIDVKDAGTIQAKGFSEPVEVFEVVLKEAPG